MANRITAGSARRSGVLDRDGHDDRLRRAPARSPQGQHGERPRDGRRRRAADERDEIAPLHDPVPPGAPTKDSTALLHCGISIWPMSLVGQNEKPPLSGLCQLTPAADITWSAPLGPDR